ncbi:hypothetical protein [Pseudomonas aeruginosa]|uniref:hypothetical protein n=8 Tax=Gammaproteobacteria TaxID=1236 RepID=UPI002287690C|nr:hypothetical protein [Pseudomonas aeruginosa]WAO17705.1 hypothetical protein OZ175_03410 [Pseudomonas aeruginosa]
MAYFKLEEPVRFHRYPFDFHSHFAGILPVESNSRWTRDRRVFRVGERQVSLEKGQELSLIGLLMSARGVAPDVDGKALEEARQAAHYELFELALQRMVRRNPFAATDRQGYLRGECAAENIYLACLILAQRFGRTSPPAAIDQPAIYLGTLELLDASAVRDSETDQFVRYFNRKIWSGNKYTPFDDAYWARGAIRDRHPGEFACLTLGFLLHEGISHTQTATGEDEVAFLDSLFEQFNASEKTAYRLLAHTAHGYASEAAFDAELHRILRHFEIQQGQPPQARLVGIDLLGMETATGLYRQFFDFLLGQAAVFRHYLDGKPETRKVVLHIHCGEGTGVSDDNRSLCGYFLRNANALDDFYAALSAYAWKCYGNTIRQGKARLRERENLQDRDKAPSALAGLFDELFFGNSLTASGLRLRRFDITSGTTQALVAYYARTNVVNLCQALASRDADGNSYYRRLLESDLFSLRIGHAYYYRNYLASKFPELCFDTNLGSNFITGASGLFDSLQEYRLNRGLRHLDGYVGTDQLKELSLAIAYQGEQRLDPQQMQYVHALAESQSGFDELGEHLPGTPGWAKPALEQFFASQCALYRSEEDRYFQFEAYRRLFAQVLNWRSYLLGADGQGVEHSNVQDEAIRMALLLNYAAADRHGRVPVASLENAQRLLVQLGSAYWEETIGAVDLAGAPHRDRELQRFEGFAAPPRSCASPPAAVEERPMSAYARYIRRRALAAADRPAQRSPDASEETRDQPPPSRPASGKRLLEISDSDAAKLLAVLKLLG